MAALVLHVMHSSLRQPVRLVPARAAGSAGILDCPPALRDHVGVVTLHDGDEIPEDVAAMPGVRMLAASGALSRAVDAVRDFGADAVASAFAGALGLDGHRRVSVARAVVDFNRFPGLTMPGDRHEDRKALGGAIANALSADERRYVLRTYYDGISDRLDAFVRSQQILVSFHTYDPRNRSNTLRPEISILTRSDSYQRSSRLPPGLFDPLFPHELVESCARRALAHRVALTVERAGLGVEQNYPYCLPDGSLEIRSQPWFFFTELREVFEHANPGTADDPAFIRVWEMLRNTNQRATDARALGAYLHAYGDAPTGHEAAFAASGRAYETIAAFLAERDDFVPNYRRSARRTSALTIEVRKDLLWRYESGRPVAPLDDAAARIGRLLAEGVATFLRVDLPDSA